MLILVAVRALILASGLVIGYIYGKGALLSIIFGSILAAGGKADRKEVVGMLLIGVVVFISGLYLVHASIFRPADELVLPLIMAVIEGGAFLLGYLVKQLRRR